MCFWFLLPLRKMATCTEAIFNLHYWFPFLDIKEIFKDIALIDKIKHDLIN